MLTLILKEKKRGNCLLTVVKPSSWHRPNYSSLLIYFQLWNILYRDVFAFIIADVKLKSSSPSLDNHFFPLHTVYRSSLFDFFFNNLCCVWHFGECLWQKALYYFSVWVHCRVLTRPYHWKNESRQQFNQAVIEKLKVVVINMDLGLLLFEWVLAREHGGWVWCSPPPPSPRERRERGNTKETSSGRSFLSS